PPPTRTGAPTSATPTPSCSPRRSRRPRSRGPGMTPPSRIAIYGVGQYGTMIARLAVEKGWPVVAAFNRSGPKVGRDLGRVAGLDRDLGVVVQDVETGDYAGLDADLAVVTHRDLLRANMDAYRRLMG